MTENVITLSAETLEVLKYFVGVNEGVVFQSGTKQRTISADQGILVEAEFTENFPKKVPVADLGKFIQNVELMSSKTTLPALAFEDKWIAISPSGMLGQVNQYPYGAEKLIKVPPNKTLDASSAKWSVAVSKDQISRILKFAAVNGSSEIALGSDQASAYLEAFSSSDAEAPKTRIDIGPSHPSEADAKVADEFREVFKTDRLSKVIPADYSVSIVEKAFAKFNSAKVVFFVAVEK